MARRVGMGRTEGWEPYLEPGERILWTGAPEPGLRITLGGLWTSAFGVLFFGFSVFWVYTSASLSADAPGPFKLFPLFGLPFVLIGFHLFVGHYFWDLRRRARTRYAISNRNAYIASSAFRRTLKSYPITAETQLDFEPGPPATIYFASEVHGVRRDRSIRPIGFERIKDGETAYRILRDVRSGRA